MKLARIAMARGRAEAEVAEDPNAADRTTVAGAIEDELHCLLETLQELSSMLLKDANSAFEVASERRIGRPKTKPSTRIGAIFMGVPWPEKGKPGRPKRVPIDDMELLAAAKRIDRNATTRDVAMSIASDYLSKAGQLHTSNWRRQQELGEVAANLEKRISALRRGVRKRTPKGSD